jgi:ADP-ribose pyrophosphatase YjhB (NUDIX family)
MHYLQKYMLDILRRGDEVRYTDLLPPGIESSHARYHLGQLETSGYVRKQPAGTYALTTEGKTLVDYLSTVGVRPKRTPKVITYTLLTHGDQLLLYQKDKEPYKGLVGLIGGKVHFGEDMTESAVREVHEKFGWQIPSPSLVGVADIRIREGDKLLSHVIAYVHQAALPDLATPAPACLVRVRRKELATRSGLMPDLTELLDATETNHLPFVLSVTKG